MSERRGESWIVFIALVAFIWALIAMLVNLNQSDSIRDLQRRVGELERSSTIIQRAQGDQLQELQRRVEELESERR